MQDDTQQEGTQADQTDVQADGYYAEDSMGDDKLDLSFLDDKDGEGDSAAPGEKSSGK